MSSAMFSKKSASEGHEDTACLKLYPGPPRDGCSYESSHNQEDSAVEITTPLGRTEVEKEACLFSNSCSELPVPSNRPTMIPDGGARNCTSSMASFSRSCSTSNTGARRPSATFPLKQVKATTMSSEQCSSDSTISSDSEFSSSVLGDQLKVQLPPSSSSSKSDLDEIDIRVVPAKALNVPTRTRLSLMLNPPKVMRNDWTALASEMGFEYEMIENISLERDPMKAVLAQWTCQQDSTIGALLDMLEDIERNDVLHDITKLVERDARRWLERRKGDVHGQPIQDPEVSGSYPHVPKTKELRGITLEDHPSGPPEIFDAYVCFTDVDSDFVKEMISVLEKEPYNLKLCVDFRDLVPGGSYSTVTAELIENRCKRMIIVLSPDFLASEQCDFQTKFAHSIAPSARNKRLIPVMVEPCVLPTILRHITMCDYTKKDLRRWFWQRLYSSLSHS